MNILFALLSVAIGLTLLLGGYRMARFIIPLWGFVTGIAFGGAVAAEMSGTPFLGTAVGILSGIVAGIVLGALAYVYYVAAVLILFGALGYWLGSGLIMLFGFDEGILSILTGVSIGIVFGVAALVANAPKYVLIVITTLAGAVATVGGMLLLTNQIPLEAFSFAAVREVITGSVWWTLAALMLTIGGIVVQAAVNTHYRLQDWSGGVDSDPDPAHHHHLPPTPHTTGGY